MDQVVTTFHPVEDLLIQGETSRTSTSSSALSPRKNPDRDSGIVADNSLSINSLQILSSNNSKSSNNRIKYSPTRRLLNESPAKPKSEASSTTSSISSSIWNNQKLLSSSPKNNNNSITNKRGGGGHSKPKKDLQECIASELSGLLPLQLGEEINPLCKEGYTYVLDAATSSMVRKTEDPLTYLNKDMFYGLTLEFTPSATRPCFPATNEVTSVIMLQFREKKDPRDAIAHWEFWQSRQHSPKLRLLDIDAKGCSGLIGEPKEIAHNAIAVTWNPSHSPAFVMMTVRCLSTDFSSQKGVKGIPLHVQIDTYEDAQSDVVCDRAFCQIKTFCDKGAERKAREEEKRMSKHLESNSSQGFILQAQQRSIFQRAYDLVSLPVLYVPKIIQFPTNQPVPKEEQPSDGEEEEEDENNSESRRKKLRKENEALNSVGANNNGSSGNSKLTIERLRNKAINGSVRNSTYLQQSNLMNNRVLIYAKQDNEEVYTPLHIVPPTVQGLIRAISHKYQIDSVDIRFVFRETLKGIIVKVDDDMIKYYSNGDVFSMKVMATEDANNGHLFYDVIFTEAESSPHFASNKKEINRGNNINKNGGKKSPMSESAVSQSSVSGTPEVKSTNDESIAEKK